MGDLLSQATHQYSNAFYACFVLQPAVHLSCIIVIIISHAFRAKTYHVRKTLLLPVPAASKPSKVTDHNFLFQCHVVQLAV